MDINIGGALLLVYIFVVGCYFGRLLEAAAEENKRHPISKKTRFYAIIVFFALSLVWPITDWFLTARRIRNSRGV